MVSDLKGMEAATEDELQAKLAALIAGKKLNCSIAVYVLTSFLGVAEEIAGLRSKATPLPPLIFESNITDNIKW